MAKSIFEKQATLAPSAMRTVAERRFDDASALCDTGRNSRANGVAYLAGFVIEILLKAKLVELFSSVARTHPQKLKTEDSRIWSLIWRAHDLQEMLDKMNDLQASLRKKGERDGYDYLGELRKICATWTIHARYSSRTMLMADAAALLDRVRKIKEVLK